MHTSVRQLSKRVLSWTTTRTRAKMYIIIPKVAGDDVHEAQRWPKRARTLQAHSLDVAIIDIGLPGWTGHELARQIRSKPRGLKRDLTALTGYGFPEDLRTFCGLGTASIAMCSNCCAADLQQVTGNRSA